MTVYKICHEKYAQRLTASGTANRWNRKDEYVIYTANSISLSTLEMIAHRSNIIASQRYKLLTIELDADVSVQTIKPDALPENWRTLEAYIELQEKGSQWYQKSESLVLKVPSAIVPQEFNYILNTNHPDFEKIKLVKVEDFTWDERIL